MADTLVEATAKYIERVKADAYEEGQLNATSISLGDFGYGSQRSSIVVKEFTSFLELRRWLKTYRWRRGGDNPGQLYSQGSELIRLYRTDEGSVKAVACISSYYDV